MIHTLAFYGSASVIGLMFVGIIIKLEGML